MKAGVWTKIEPKLSEHTLGILNAQNWTEMTPVQAATLPLFLKNTDVAVEAPTGSGKTLSFVVPIFEKLVNLKLSKHQVGALIITPTRELAQQIDQVIKLFVSGSPLTSMLLTGGCEISVDIANFTTNGAHIVVATPGRLDYMMQSCDIMSFKEFQVLVLDEADRYGLQCQLTEHFATPAKAKKNSTQTKQVDELVKAGMRNPMKITVNVESKDNTLGKTQSIPSTLSNYYMLCERDQKLSALVQFLLDHPNEKVIIFFLTCFSVNYLWKLLSMLPQLKSRSFFSLHGKVPANRRTEVLKNFVATESGILCTTDLAARGLDFDQHPIHWIVQYDAPQDPAFFIHRVGRAARMGQMGSAVLLLTKAELTYIDFLNVRKVPIVEMDVPPHVDVIPTIKGWIRKDRELLDKGKLAFVSWVRAYKEHHCNYIFLLKNLDFVALLNGFPLLEAPKMPELQGVPLVGFLTEETSKIPYLDKKREAKRQATLKQDLNKQKTKEKLKENKKKKWEARAKQEEPEEMEEDDIDRDYAMLKKLKKKKITEDEFEAEVEADLESVLTKQTKRPRPEQVDKQPAKKQKTGKKK